MREWFGNWWLLILSLILLALGLYFIFTFQLVGIESARWALSALVQAGAALVGIFYVAMGILWNQANQETERLLSLIPSYMERLSPSGANVRSFINLLAQSVGSITTQEQKVQEALRTCCIRLLALSSAALRYLNETTTGNLRQFIGDSLGIDFTDEEEKRIERDNFRISLDATAFFSYLARLEECIDTVKRFGVLDIRHFQEINSSRFYHNVLHRARRLDRAYVSLWKLRFIDYFRGKGIMIISALWLICLTTGLMTLFALDGIPADILPYIASIPLAIGVIAMGFTLSLGFRAMSSKD